mmetsp:Transcript_78096/g.130300  ORF Transcript_78096/g.130300 Transcript_78096/m.130300 type:complete len:86 (-) Transcript_78096:136-393(-)
MQLVTQVRRRVAKNRIHLQLVALNLRDSQFLAEPFPPDCQRGHSAAKGLSNHSWYVMFIQSLVRATAGVVTAHFGTVKFCSSFFW